MANCEGGLQNVFVVVLLLGVIGARAARVNEVRQDNVIQSLARPAESNADVAPKVNIWAPLEPAFVAQYLGGFGFEAFNAKTWRVAPGGEAGPQLELQVTGHNEFGGHTLYKIECALTLPGSARMTWSSPRRLEQFRKALKDPVKAELGREFYKKHFADAPFARRGGMPGTTARLTKWVGALSACVNTGSAPPSLVASILRFLEAPEPESEHNDVTLDFEDGNGGAGTASGPSDISAPVKEGNEQDEVEQDGAQTSPTHVLYDAIPASPARKPLVTRPDYFELDVLVRNHRGRNIEGAVAKVEVDGDDVDENLLLPSAPTDDEGWTRVACPMNAPVRIRVSPPKNLSASEMEDGQGYPDRVQKFSFQQNCRGETNDCVHFTVLMPEAIY